MNIDDFQPLSERNDLTLQESVQKLLNNARDMDREYMRGYGDGAEAALTGVLALVR